MQNTKLVSKEFVKLHFKKKKYFKPFLSCFPQDFNLHFHMCTDQQKQNRSKQTDKIKF